MTDRDALGRPTRVRRGLGRAAGGVTPQAAAPESRHSAETGVTVRPHGYDAPPPERPSSPPEETAAHALPAALAAAVLDQVPVAVYVFTEARLRYLNPAARAQRERVARRHGIQISVLLRDQVRHLATGEREPDAVVLLTAPSSEAYSVHIAAVADGTRTAHVVTVRELGSNRESFARRYALSAREQEVVDLVMRGYSNRDIAAALGCSEATAKKHLTHVFDKVGVDSRTQLVSRLV